MSVRALAVDVGSVRSNNFAWAGLDLPGRQPVGDGGRHPEGAARVAPAGGPASRAVNRPAERGCLLSGPSEHARSSAIRALRSPATPASSTPVPAS
jgi:hypothetical protein